MRFDFIQKQIFRFFRLYILFVIRVPWLFILIPMLLTILLSAGLSYREQAFLKDDLDQYVPVNAPARKELQQLDQLFHIDDLDPFYAMRRYIFCSNK
ncbi:unnamed protein product [Gongylonema pulchrum]|uniref:ABC transporter permease n=1 Tax=Gongylonema pulchrum TaxID=637853 RepID=A0A183D1T0_9BILA|nr:unnamed protein product [Gongylonema pulchrum]